MHSKITPLLTNVYAAIARLRSVLKTTATATTTNKGYEKKGIALATIYARDNVWPDLGLNTKVNVRECKDKYSLHNVMVGRIFGRSQKQNLKIVEK